MKLCFAFAYVSVYQQYDAYNDRPTDHFISLECLIYYIFLHCVVAAFCQLLGLLNEYCIFLHSRINQTAVDEFWWILEGWDVWLQSWSDFGDDPD